MSISAPVMMPGQEPYTLEEMAQVSGLIAGACQAEEVFADYELEDYAKAQKQD